MGLNLVMVFELVKLGRGRGRTGNLNLNGPVHHPYGITANLDTGTIRPGAVGQPKPPGVPGTGDDTVGDVAAAQRCPHVGTNVVDGKILTLVVKYGKELAGHLDHFP